MKNFFIICFLSVNLIGVKFAQGSGCYTTYTNPGTNLASGAPANNDYYVDDNGSLYQLSGKYAPTTGLTYPFPDTPNKHYYWYDCRDEGSYAGMCRVYGYTKNHIADSGDYEVCPPDPPGHCSNGSRDPNEIGVDCGGPCPPCNAAVCPPGYTPWYHEISGEDFTTGTNVECLPDQNIYVRDIDSLGNCPKGYFRHDYEDSDGNPKVNCLLRDEYLPAPVLYNDTAGGDPPEPNEAIEPPLYTDKHLEQYNANANIIPNPDGTTTVETTSTTTKSDGSSINTTKSETYDADGNLISVSSTTETTGNSEDDFGNYDYSISGDGDFDSDIPGDLDSHEPDFDDLDNSIDSAISGLTDFDLSLSSMQCSFTVSGLSFLGSSSSSYDIDFCQYESQIDNIGSVFVGLAGFLAVMILFL